jgi:hypothetical protein
MEKYFWMADNSCWSASSAQELVDRMRVSSRTPGQSPLDYMEKLSERAWLFSEIEIRSCCADHFVFDLISNQLLQRSN